jgi:cyclic-di-AMP phosphodiesterase PgpH
MGNEAKNKPPTGEIRPGQIRPANRAAFLGSIPPEVAVLAATILATTILFPYTMTVQDFALLKPGEVAKETIIAPFTFDILKPADELQREQKSAVDKVLLVADFNNDGQREVRKKFTDLKSDLLMMAGAKGSDSALAGARARVARVLSAAAVASIMKNFQLVDEAMSQAEQALRKGVLDVLPVASPQRLAELRTQYHTSFERHLDYDKEYLTVIKSPGEVTSAVSDLPVKEFALEAIATKLKNVRGFDAAPLNSVYEMLDAFLDPNVKVNIAETARRRERAAAEVLTIKGKVIKDTEIVRKHQEVTPEIAEKLRSLGEAIRSQNASGEKRRIFFSNIGRLLFSLIPLLFLAFYVKRFQPRIAANSRHAVALSLILVFQLVVMRIGLFAAPRLLEGVAEPGTLMPEFLIPVTIGAMLATILFNFEIGFVVSLYTSIVFAIAVGFDETIFLFALAGCFVAGFASKNVRYRWDFYKAIPPVIFMYALMAMLWNLIGYRLEAVPLMQNIVLTVINVVGATILAMVAVSVFENMFDLTTDMKLVELSDMNHPILKRLSIEAAGTYNHSVLVGNLAESAAAKIGANPLLARVGSYYHDIGKLEKTEYFVENAMGNDRDRHSKLSPSMSSLIISSHVKAGLELARKHRLPGVIQDIILQHHGTSTVSFFFEKAQEQDPHKQVQEEDFRYPGPRPQTRESAIIMLADSVEAASRSLATSSPKLLRDLVKKIIRDKFMASQLDQCDLTLKDLDDIVEGFMPILQGIFHTRIEYPNK